MDWIGFEDVLVNGNDVNVVINGSAEPLYTYQNNKYINYGGDKMDGAKPSTPYDINVALIEQYCKKEFDKALREEIKPFQKDYIAICDLKLKELTPNQIAPIIGELKKLATQVDKNGDRVGFEDVVNKYDKLLNVITTTQQLNKNNSKEATVKTYIANNQHD